MSYLVSPTLSGYVNYLAIACALTCYVVAYGRFHSINIWIIIVVCFILFLSIQILNFRLGRVSHFIVPFFNILLAFVIITKKLYIKPISYAYYMIASYIGYKVLILHIDPNEVFAYTSRNMISTIAIMYAVLIYLILFLNHQKIVVLPALVAFILSAIGIGRSGIICSALLVVGVLFYKFCSAEKKEKKLYITILLLFTGFSVYFFRDAFSGEEIEFVSRLQTYGLNDPARAQLLDQYIKNIDFYNFIRGYDIMNDSIYSSWNNNPHNSWIYLHYNLGIWGVILGVSIFFSGLFFFFKKYYFITLLLGVIVLRSAADSVLFFSSYDFIIYSFIILAFTLKNRVDKKDVRLTCPIEGGVK